MHINEQKYTFNKLEWDTEFFGVSSARAVLHQPVSLREWDELSARFREYQFISITNRDSNPINSQIIGKDTSAFLADINIQFEKKLNGLTGIPSNITIHQELEWNEDIVKLADFQFSKFTEDPELAKRGGDKVYHKWVYNSFEKAEKFFALSHNEKGDINGFLLYSYSDSNCVIELIAVSKVKSKGGIGTSLFNAVEHSSQKMGFTKIIVGTQVRNIGAINFYHKVGCKQVGCHQVYHLWNL
jgi:dTDP-4-amino-4,6-dideoxy-D-galactose acyltransferase